MIVPVTITKLTYELEMVEVSDLSQPQPKTVAGKGWLTLHTPDGSFTVPWNDKPWPTKVSAHVVIDMDSHGGWELEL